MTELTDILDPLNDLYLDQLSRPIEGSPKSGFENGYVYVKSGTGKWARCTLISWMALYPQWEDVE